MIKVALIGCGAMGLMHLHCYKALSKNVQVVAVADTDSKKTEEALKICNNNVTVYNDAMTMLDKESLDIYYNSGGLFYGVYDIRRYLVERKTFKQYAKEAGFNSVSDFDFLYKAAELAGWSDEERTSEYQGFLGIEHLCRRKRLERYAAKLRDKCRFNVFVWKKGD